MRFINDIGNRQYNNRFQQLHISCVSLNVNDISESPHLRKMERRKDNIIPLHTFSHSWETIIDLRRQRAKPNESAGQTLVDADLLMSAFISGGRPLGRAAS